MDNENAINETPYSLCKILKFFIKRSFNEICYRLCYYIISLGSCFLAIYVALIANTIISQAPIMFLKIAEITQGELDLQFTPSSSAGINPMTGRSASYARYFNMTVIDNLTYSDIGLLAPRLTFDRVRIGKSNRRNRTVGVTLMLIDSEREKTHKLGSKYVHPVLKEGECAIHSSHAKFLNLKVGMKFTLTIPMRDYINLLRSIHQQKWDKVTPVNITINCTVGSIFRNLGGKVPIDNEDDYTWMELKYFLKHLSKQIKEPDHFKEFLSKFDPYQLVSLIAANNPKREIIYVDNDFYRVQRTMAGYSNEVISKLGFFPANAKMPILSMLLLFYMGAVFLSIILNLIVILLAAISTFLIYSLLTISVETRMFELGILRMLGLGRFGLAFLVLVQAMMFVLPAFVLAFALSFPGLASTSSAMKAYFGFGFRAVPSGTSIIWAICVGLLVPLLASALPIKEVLSKNLVESLDMMHSKAQGIHISIEYEQKGSSLTMLAFGVIAIIYGMSIYYFLPLSLLALNLQLMLWIMLSILLAIIIGLIMLSLNVTHIMESILVHIFLFYESSVMKFLILKNMVSHKLRNRRTIIIYALSLGFLLFAIVAYTVELRNAQITILSRFGSYLEVIARRSQMTFQQAVQLENILINKFPGKVVDFAWTSGSLMSATSNAFIVSKVTDFSRKKYATIVEESLSPNYFDVATKLFLNVAQENKTTGISLGEQLYTARGSQGFGAGAFLEGRLDINSNDPRSTFFLSYERRNTNLLYETRPIFMLFSGPALRMRRAVTGYQHFASSTPVFMKLGNITSFSVCKWYRLSIKVKNNDKDICQEIYTALNQNSLENRKSFTVWSYSKQSDNIDSIKNFLDIMFIVIIILFMFLSFFSLSSSMTANILEQTKELSVMRSIGITRSRCVFMHVYEAFILVLTGSIIGACIGMLIGYTLCLQRVIYTNLPVEFNFPYKHLIVMFLSSVVCAILSTVSPSLYLLRKPISEISRI